MGIYTGDATSGCLTMGEGTGIKLKCVLEISFLSRVGVAGTRKLELQHLQEYPYRFSSSYFRTGNRLWTNRS